MSAEHWCEEHQEVWFKKGAMKSYAHPIRDGGKPTGKWCNEPKRDEQETLPKEKETAKISVSSQETRSQEISRHVWLKEAGETIRMWKVHPETAPKSKDGKPYAWAEALIRWYYSEMLNILGIKSESQEKGS